MNRYLAAAQSAVATLFEKQTVHWGGQPDGIPCVVASVLPYKGFRSVGSRVGDSTFTFYCPPQPVEMQPFRLDMRAWPVLELLSDVTGDPIYRQRVVAMAEAFSRHGFDPASGLGYFGETTEFDAARAQPIPVGWAGKEIYFKPTDDIPLDRLWATAPTAMARMFRSTFYGMVQRPATMDFNRFCNYGYDDSLKKHAMEFNSHHCATAYGGAYLIHWWSYLFARTGDAECLQWAEAMARKWQAAQHPVTGLVPAWFGSDRTDEDWMPPRPFGNHWDSGTAVTFLHAAKELKARPEGQKLATQLEEMGRRLITGMVKYGYDAQNRIFPQWINVDGTRANVSWYTFPTQAIRDEAVKREPILGDVFVFYGSKFYSGRRPWFLDGGNFMPYNVALAAQMTGDPWLLEQVQKFAATIREEAGKLTGEFNDENQWSLPANASYIKTMLLVAEMTGQRRYVEWAQELADRELEFLSRPLPAGQPEWWRMHFRNAWIEALLLLHRATIAGSAQDAPVLRKISGIIERQIATRCGARPAVRIALAVQPDLPEEAYRIESGAGQEVRIVGGSARGVLYGAGKFLRTSRYDQGGFTPSTWRGASAPECPFRAMYFATHFNNFYEDAPFEEVRDYLQEVALWGYNAIEIYYPTDQFTGPEDPASIAWFVKYKAVFAEAKACGLRVGLGLVPDHCFKPAPPELASTKMIGRSNHGEAVCTSKPAGRALVVQICQWLMDQFREVGLDFIVFGPYDDGGCGCTDCWPWGPKGFLSLSRELVPHIRARHPGCELWLHTWCFDLEDGNPPLHEWEGLAASLQRDKSWVDGLMSGWSDAYYPRYPLDHGVPGGLPLVEFPEISMYGAFPWGGYGTNPFPSQLQQIWDQVKHVLAGGMPYSEGIYEDINKAVIAGFYWDKKRSAEESVREYAAFEFGPDVADRVVELVRILESNLNRHYIKATSRQAVAIAQEVDAALTEPARRSWRWRIVYLRALIDREMFEQPGTMTPALQDAFRELTVIYHAERANDRVKPPGGRQLSARLLSERHSPFVKTWSIAELQPPADLANVEAVKLGDPLGWRRYTVSWNAPAGEDDLVNVHDLFGMRDGLVYLANRFSVEQSGDWILHLGHDGGAKVFVDGRAVLCEPTRINPAPPTRSQARVRLEQGTHEIAIAFDTDQGNGWGLYVCFERPATAPETSTFPKRVE